MKNKSLLVALLCSLLPALARADDPDAAAGPKVITVDAAAQARYAVSVVELREVSAATAVTTTARVLDPGGLLQLDSELSAAAAGLAASRAEAQRNRKLYEEDRTASARAVESADAQEAADLQRVNAAQRRLALEWGPGVAALAAATRAKLLDDLVNGRAELVRVEVPVGVPEPGPGSDLEIRADAAPLTGSVLGTLRAADPRLQTRGVLLELRGAQARLVIGQMVTAEIPSGGAPRVKGVVLPRSALLRKEGRVWVYVQSGASAFVRREVHDYRPIAAGWFVSAGFRPGERVVSAGAAALLGVEHPAEADTDTD